MSEEKLHVAIISAGRTSSTIDDEITSMDVWPSRLAKTSEGKLKCSSQYLI